MESSTIGCQVKSMVHSGLSIWSYTTSLCHCKSEHCPSIRLQQDIRSHRHGYYGRIKMPSISSDPRRTLTKQSPTMERTVNLYGMLERTLLLSDSNSNLLGCQGFCFGRSVRRGWKHCFYTVSFDRWPSSTR